MEGFGARAPSNFKTFDFFDRDAGIATSAKTLDTRALGYLDRPSRVYGRLKGYVDQIYRFDHDSKKGFVIKENEVEVRRLELAVPVTTSPEQFTQIQRAIDYATSLNIAINVKRIQ